MVRLRRLVPALLGLAFLGSVVPAPGVETTAFAVGPGTQAEWSSLPRRVSDVPRFAGPATLELRGRVGAYRWTDVAFGTQEVVLRVALVPLAGDDTCAARVRLGSVKPPLYRRSFNAASAEKVVHRAIVDVDYATEPLMVRSDCGAWSLTFVPLEDPAVALAIKERHYEVNGRTIADLGRALGHFDGEWAALARTRATWMFRWIDRGSRCEVVSGDVSVEAVLKMPRWEPPADVPRSVKSEWRRVRDNLRLHELGHVTIALQAADAVNHRLDAGLEARTCERVKEMADAKAARIWRRHQRRDDRYDRATEHGRTQGTWFRAPKSG